MGKYMNDIEKATELQKPSFSQRAWTLFIDTLCVLFNTVCTVMLVFSNKAVLTDPQFRKLQCTTAAWHFFATALVLSACFAWNSSRFKTVWLPVSCSLPVAILCAGFVLLGNLSLALNPVPFYQIAKIMTGPCVVALNYMLFRKTLARPLLVSVLACCGGVAMTISGIAASNVLGTLVAVLGFITTALYQIYIGLRMSKFNVTAPQLLFNIAPWAVVVLVCFIPFFDQAPTETLDSDALRAFWVSGILAAGLNLSQFLIIGRTSALTFNMVSNAKNIIIISYGWAQEGKVIGFNDMLGVTLALGGATVYSIQSQRAAAAAAAK